MRSFVGIPLPPLESVIGLVEELRSCGADLKLVDPKHLHVTLKFLGEIPEAQAPIILDRLRAVDFPHDYPLRIENVGAFPNWRKLNVLWVGMRDVEGKLGQSFALSERVFAELAFPQETRPLAPHVTVARKRSERGRDEAKRVLESHRNESFGEVRVHGPVLYKSTLTPTGSVYESLGEVVP